MRKPNKKPKAFSLQPRAAKSYNNSQKPKALSIKLLENFKDIKNLLQNIQNYRNKLFIGLAKSFNSAGVGR